MQSYDRVVIKQLMMPTLKCAKVLTRETWRSSSEKNSAMNFLRVWGPCGMSVPGTELQYYGNNLEASEEQISAYICVFLYIFIRCRNNYNKKYFLYNYVSYLFRKQTCYLNSYLYPGTLQMWWCAGNYKLFQITKYWFKRLNSSNIIKPKPLIRS